MPVNQEMQEIYESFLIETSELLDNISQDLMKLESQVDDIDLLNKIFRSFHTIKGTSSFMGFEYITKVTHHAEDLLNKLRRSELQANQEIIDVLLEVHDWIVLIMDNIQNNIDSAPNYQDTIDKIEVLKNNKPSDNAPEIVDNSDNIIKSPLNNSEIKNIEEIDNSAYSKVVRSAEIFSKPGDFTLEEMELIQNAFDEVNKQFLERNSQNELLSTKTIETIIPENNVINDNIPKSNLQKSKVTTDTIRIDVSRLEALMDLSGELVLSRNRLAQLTTTLEAEFDDKNKIRDLIDTTSQVDFITSEIQAAVMRMRMVQIAKLYQKAPRMVRDLSKEFNKKINLVTHGEETEIDRGILEELNDPLVHMIRNSCDHGIETSEERLAQGKPIEGTITLNAEQEGNAIVLRISDDGKGINPDVIKQKAIEKGFVTEEQVSQLTKRDILQFIFLPGFSTAQKISAVSGRGVGMDVVRTNIQNLKGIIEIESEVGKGSTFIIKLPLTLAIIQGLLIRIQNEKYALPLSTVLEVVAASVSNIYTINQNEVVRLRDEVYPLIRLDSVLKTPNINPSLENRYIVVVGLGTYRVGLVVDELLGQQEIVIKSLGSYLGHVFCIAGSTILGDGSVIMIIDVAELAKLSFKDNYFM